MRRIQHGWNKATCHSNGRARSVAAPAAAAPAAQPAVVIGDARDAASYQRALRGAKADLLLTDPPYCILTRRRKGGDLRDPKPGRQRKLEHELVVRFESVREYRAFSADWMAAALPHLAPQAPAIIWTNQLGKAPILAAAAQHGYSHLAGEFVWAKRSSGKLGAPADSSTAELLLRVYEVALVLLRQPPAPPNNADLPLPWSVVTGYQDEPAAVGSAAGKPEASAAAPSAATGRTARGAATAQPSSSAALPAAAAASGRQQAPPSSGLTAESGSHPHQKPRSALLPLVLAWSRPGQLILDPFSGTGAISATALALGRRAAAIELRPEAPQLAS